MRNSELHSVNLFSSLRNEVVSSFFGITLMIAVLLFFVSNAL